MAPGSEPGQEPDQGATLAWRRPAAQRAAVARAGEQPLGLPPNPGDGVLESRASDAKNTARNCGMRTAPPASRFAGPALSMQGSSAPNARTPNRRAGRRVENGAAERLLRRQKRSCQTRDAGGRKAIVPIQADCRQLTWLDRVRRHCLPIESFPQPSFGRILSALGGGAAHRPSLGLLFGALEGRCPSP